MPCRCYRNGTKPEANPFEEDEWDEGDGEALVDTGEPGVPVKALYDYEGAEADELSFKQGKCCVLYNGLGVMRLNVLNVLACVVRQAVFNSFNYVETFRTSCTQM